MALIAGKVKDKSELIAKFEYGAHDLWLKLRYLSVTELTGMEARSRKQEWDPKTHKQSDDVDRKKMCGEYAKHAVRDWNLTGGMLEKMIDMEEYPEGDIPFSAEDCEALMVAHIDLFRFVQTNCRDMAIFDEVRKQQAIKNSSASREESSPLRVVADELPPAKTA